MNTCRAILLMTLLSALSAAAPCAAAQSTVDMAPGPAAPAPSFDEDAESGFVASAESTVDVAPASAAPARGDESGAPGADDEFLASGAEATSAPAETAFDAPGETGHDASAAPADDGAPEPAAAPQDAPAAGSLSPAAVAQCLAAAYPDTVQAQGDAVLVKGRRVPVRRSNETNYERRLNDAGLIDQLEQPYPLDFAVPDEDPGRMRDGAFFDAMYGDGEAQVRANLEQTYWAPSGRKVPFNRVNGAAEALAAVGRELARTPELARFMSRTNGSFNYRVVAGTTRKSPHSYGTAIDFALPRDLGMYWQWSGCKAGRSCPYPPRLLNDPTLRRVVEVFERHGFIWGGKWRHYDSVHFEYRPELLRPECRAR